MLVVLVAEDRIDMDTISIFLILISITLCIIALSFQIKIINDLHLKNSMAKLQNVYESIIDLDVSMFLISLSVSTGYILCFFSKTIFDRELYKVIVGETQFLKRVIIIFLFLMTSILLIIQHWFLLFILLQFVLVFMVLLLHISDSKKLSG